MVKKIICNSCDSEIVPGMGLTIINEEYKSRNFCKACLKHAMHVLGIKKGKNPDEVRLLTRIRKFLKYESEN